MISISAVVIIYLSFIILASSLFYSQYKSDRKYFDDRMKLIDRLDYSLNNSRANRCY